MEEKIAENMQINLKIVEWSTYFGNFWVVFHETKNPRAREYV